MNLATRIAEEINTVRDEITLNNSIITKAEFNALAEERKANRAGSGFDIFGWASNAAPSADYIINEGLWVRSTAPNVIYSSRSDAAAKGTSKSKIPIVNINGVQHKFFDNGGDRITLPTVPNIYPHDTVLTPEQIASGVIKHADASNSGLIVNGKFDTDTSWTKEPAWSISSGKAILNGSLTGNIKQSITCPINKVMIAEFDVLDYTPTAIIDFKYNNVTISAPRANGRYSVEFKSVGTAEIIIFGQFANASIDNIAVYPADAISRSDFVFLESWHEDISEKNIVYPLGNVQYLGGNTDGLTGIVNGAFTGFETYSLFGNWQTPSALIGKGYVWSSLTEAQKRAFVSNPENNCYLDGDKVIQVRYRVRVVQGLGDSWHNVNPQNVSYMCYAEVSSNFVAAKGKAVSLPSDFRIANANVFIPSSTYSSSLIKENGIFEMRTIENVSSFAHEVKCYALPIALASRRNQGMYHNVYNPNGTKLASDGLDCFTTTISFNSISDCFDSAKLLTASGYIGTVSGRPDGLFYDQVHEGDILDLRNSSKKVEDYNRLISREFSKLVAGTNRGKEGERFTEIKTQTTTGTVATVEVNDGTKYKSGDVAYIYDLTASTVKGRFVVKSISSNTLTVNTTFAKLANSYMVSGASSTRTKSNTLLVCDVIGNPSNYPSIWKTNKITFTTLHTAEDGTSLLPDGTLDNFKLSRKANATPLLCLRSTDNGATWTSFTPTFSAATNEITLTDEPANNLVMVYYQTHTSMAVPAVTGEVLSFIDPTGINFNDKTQGAFLVDTLIGKTPVGGSAPTLLTRSLLTRSLNPTSKCFDSSYGFDAPTHSQMLFYNSYTPAVKILPYLTRSNGKAYLNLVFKEMKYNGTSWGDNSKFEIVNNVSTTTDLNAQTVLVGHITVELPYFIGADE